jgi:putative acetyltransferase
LNARRIRPERPEDFPAIAAVVIDAFNPKHGSEVAALVERIRGSEHYVPELALLAEDESGVVGHVMLSWTALEGGTRDRILMLSPMSVRTDRQRRGVGTDLIENVLERAEARGEPAVMLEGVPAYYPRFGFERASALGFQPPREGIPDEAFMVKRLSAYDPALAGRIVYPSTFDGV